LLKRRIYFLFKIVAVNEPLIVVSPLAKSQQFSPQILIGAFVSKRTAELG